MRKMHYFAVAISLILASYCASAQVQNFHQSIQQTYSFQPHLLANAEIEKKSAVLDAFWSNANAHKAESITSLRKELSDFSNPPFFLFDGSMLLLSLSDAHEDRVIALAAIAQCDLRDVQPREYFLRIHSMAVQGEDTTAAALHILEDPKFTVVIPAHALTLGQNFSLIYMLLPTEQRFWLPPAIVRLGKEQDATAQQSLIRLLWYAQTPEADKAIAAFAADITKPDASRKEAEAALKRAGAGGRVLGKALSVGTSEADLREKRHKRMRAVSDEALIDLDRYTFEIAAKRK